MPASRKYEEELKTPVSYVAELWKKKENKKFNRSRIIANRTFLEIQITQVRTGRARCFSFFE